MDLEYFKQYFKNNGVNLKMGISLYYHWGPMFGDDEIILHFSGNIIKFDVGMDYGGISIATPCLPSEINTTREYIDATDSVEWNNHGVPIKEEFIKYLRQLHRVDGEMTKAAH